MDHMRIWDNEPSSVVLTQTKRLKMIARKCQKQAETKAHGVINPHKNNFNQFRYG